MREDSAFEKERNSSLCHYVDGLLASMFRESFCACFPHVCLVTVIGGNILEQNGYVNGQMARIFRQSVDQPSSARRCALFVTRREIIFRECLQQKQKFRSCSNEDEALF